MDIRPDPVDRNLQYLLDRLLSGESSLESILEQYPEVAQGLRPELEAALWLASQQERLGPRPGFVPASRRRLLSRIKQHRSPVLDALRRIPQLVSNRIVLRALPVILLLMVFLAGGLISAVAQESIPGDAIYPLKIFTENARIAFTFNPSDRAHYQIVYIKHRVAEMEALMLEGRLDQTQEAMRAFDWRAREAVAQLEILKTQDPDRAQELAGELSSLLQDQAQVLELLSASAPASMPAEFAQAAEDSLAGVEDMQDILLGLGDFATPTMAVPEISGTPTPTLLLSTATAPREAVTAEANASSTLRPTQTPQPSNTRPAAEKIKDSPTPTPEPSNTRRPTITRKPSNTPRPTNTHRPVKTESAKPTVKPSKTSRP